MVTRRNILKGLLALPVIGLPELAKALPKEYGEMQMGDVFTIAGVYAVNPKTHETVIVEGYKILQRFVCNGNGGFWPNIIPRGLYTNCVIAPNTTFKKTLITRPYSTENVMEKVKKPSLFDRLVGLHAG